MKVDTVQSNVKDEVPVYSVVRYTTVKEKQEYNLRRDLLFLVAQSIQTSLLPPVLHLL